MLVTDAVELAPSRRRYWLARFFRDGWRASKAAAVMRHVALILMVAFLLVEAMAEFVFWNEFTTRFNFIAVDYLIYTSEVIDNIRQSYPVGLIMTGIVLLAALILWKVGRKTVYLRGSIDWKRRGLMLIAAIALPLASYGFAGVDQMSGAGNDHRRESVSAIPWCLRKYPPSDAAARRIRGTGTAIFERLCDRNAHCPWPRGVVGGDAADSRPGHRSTAEQRPLDLHRTIPGIARLCTLFHLRGL